MDGILSSEALSRAFGRPDGHPARWATCGTHLSKAIATFEGLRIIINDVTASNSHLCACGKKAKWCIINKEPINDAQRH
jgi:hypothetical protein